MISIKNRILSTFSERTRHNDYNYINRPAVKKYLENFPYKKMLTNWNSLNIDLKSTAEYDEFYQLSKKNLLSTYSCDVDCIGPCFSCGTL